MEFTKSERAKKKGSEASLTSGVKKQKNVPPEEQKKITYKQFKKNKIWKQLEIW